MASMWEILSVLLMAVVSDFLLVLSMVMQKD